MHIPIADLHCDLLSYLAKQPKRTVNDPEAQCSLPQMKKGGVVFQALAIFTETGKGSVSNAASQFSHFQKFLAHRPAEFFPLGKIPFKPITVAPAIENASGLLEEDEPFALALDRLEKMNRDGPILYISLTWNAENRFGGGNASKKGLKRDGEILLDFLDQKKIAIDFSHTSDYLAHDLLNYIDKKNLGIQPIASHSNFRVIADVPRNLTDEIARELIRRKGKIGINFVNKFIGEEPSDFLRQIEHGIQLGGEKALCLGADFFPEVDIPQELAYMLPAFFKDYSSSDCYPRFLDLLRTRFPEETVKNIAYKNLEEFLVTAASA